MSASFLRLAADHGDVARPSAVERAVARVVAVAAGAVGTSVVAVVALADAARRRHGPPPPRNT